MVEQILDATGTSAVPPTALAAGVHFWRLFGRAGGTSSTSAGPTWEFFVGHRSATVGSVGTSVLDVNGDGFADVAVSGCNVVRIFLGSGSGVGSIATMLSAPSGSDGFGDTVGSAGDVNGDGYGDLIVGVVYSDAAYLYLGGPAGLGTKPTALAITSPEGIDFRGRPAAGAGDVNGDGYADIVVGAPRSNLVSIYFGGPSRTPGTPTTLTGPSDSGFGVALAHAGDVNGDGYADIVVGASSSGRVYLFSGRAAGVSSAPAVLDQPGATSFGTSVSSAGDVNGDGYGDVVVGSNDLNRRAYVYLGSSAGLRTPATTLMSSSGFYGYGRHVAGIGDTNGDGFAEVAVSGESTDTVYVYRGDASGVVVTPTILSGPERFGDAIAGAGDIDNDGFADLLVGAQSVVSVSFGSAMGLSSVASRLSGITCVGTLRVARNDRRPACAWWSGIASPSPASDRRTADRPSG